MKIFFSSALCGVFLFCHTLLFGQGIEFETLTFNQALEKAAADSGNQKLVFIDCYTSWCIPCMEMSQNEFPKKICGDYLNPRFVSVKFDMEKGEGIEIQKKYQVNVFPTFLILNSNGEEVNRIIGASKAEEFIEKVKAALKPENSLTGLKNTFESNKSMMTGLPYAKALMERSMDATPVLLYLYEHAMDSERFSRPYLEMVFSNLKFTDPLFKKIMIEKPRINKFMGTEVINGMIFDLVRKDMYAIASGIAERYNVHYTAEEVEQVAYTLALLDLPLDQAETHIARIALFVVKEDLDGLIAYYNKYIWSLSPSVYKGILENLLMVKAAQATASQKEAIKKYFSETGKKFEYEVKQYNIKAESIK